MGDGIFLVGMKYRLFAGIYRFGNFNVPIRYYHTMAGTTGKEGRAGAIRLLMTGRMLTVGRRGGCTHEVIFLAIAGDAGKNYYI